MGERVRVGEMICRGHFKLLVGYESRESERYYLRELISINQKHWSLGLAPTCVKISAVILIWLTGSLVHLLKNQLKIPIEEFRKDIW